MLERAIAAGRAPALARIVQEGVYVNDVVAAFPSVTPVCAATITTGVGPDRHLIPSMNWYHRFEHRYIEYGSSFSASRQFGIVRSLTDTIYRMNAEHLSNETPTVFEQTRRHGAAHRRDDLPDLPRPPSARGGPGVGAGADGDLDALPPDRLRAHGALLCRPLRQPQHRLPRTAGDARRARPAHRLRWLLPGGARPLRLHAVLAARQRWLVAQARTAGADHLDRRRRPPAGAADACRRRTGPVPRRPRRDRLLRPLADTGAGVDPAGEGARGLPPRQAEARCGRWARSWR